MKKFTNSTIFGLPVVTNDEMPESEIIIDRRPLGEIAIQDMAQRLRKRLPETTLYGIPFDANNPDHVLAFAYFTGREDQRTAYPFDI